MVASVEVKPLIDVNGLSKTKITIALTRLRQPKKHGDVVEVGMVVKLK